MSIPDHIHTEFHRMIGRESKQAQLGQCGHVFWFYGLSGSGKSTFLNIVGLLDKHDSGTITYFGVSNPKPFSKQATKLLKDIAEGQFGKRLSVAELKSMLADEITRIMDPVARPMPLYTQTPQVVLVVGVNGSGKTTTIGKLASQFKAAGKSVVIAAGDTFRAAAVEQLQIWGERAGVPVLTAPEGSDPASLAFDAMTQAQADGADLLLIDTAGRLQNRADLMEELAKIVRVIRKKDPEAPHNTLLVLDATTGQNALSQVEIFKSISDVSGLVMTKLDGTAKGGVLVALADKFGLPIHAIGVGEQIDDLAPFDPAEFASALTGADLS